MSGSRGIRLRVTNQTHQTTQNPQTSVRMGSCGSEKFPGFLGMLVAGHPAFTDGMMAKRGRFPKIGVNLSLCYPSCGQETPLLSVSSSDPGLYQSPITKSYQTLGETRKLRSSQICVPTGDGQMGTGRRGITNCASHAIDLRTHTKRAYQAATQAATVGDFTPLITISPLTTNRSGNTYRCR